MAWIKLESHTPDKTEVFQMANILGIESDAVVGKCCRVWAWFDINTTDGVTNIVTKSLLDRYCSVTGFCDAMIKVGWMDEIDDTIQLPYFDRHNSKSAKQRALTANRVSKYKESHKNVTNTVTSSVTESLPKSLDREDKRKEDKSCSNDDDKYPLINSLLSFLSKYTNRSLTNNSTLATACEDTLQKLKALTGDNFQSVIETQINIGNNPMTIKNSLNPVKDLTVIASRQITYITDKKESAPAQNNVKVNLHPKMSCETLEEYHEYCKKQYEDAGLIWKGEVYHD